MPSSEEIYVRELLVLGKGLPIWDPEPPIPHGEVHIGDVGYFWQGAFYRFFNTMSSVEENEEDGCEVPTPFTQLEMPKNAFRVDDPCAIQANAPLCSRTIKAYHLDGGSDIDHLVHGHFSVKSEQKEGAILVINSNAERHAYHDNIWMKQYVIKNVKHWKQFALKNKGIELDYDEIYFVRGVVKTKSWTVAAFHEGSESFEGQLSLHHSPVGLHAAVKWSSEKYCCPDYLSGPRRLASPEASLANSSTDFNRLSAQYTSLVANDGSPFNSVMLPGRPRGPPKKRRRRNGHTTPASHERLGSQIKPEIGDYSDLSRQESQYDTSRNQCIFLHYYKVKRRLVGPKVIKAAAEPQDLSLDNSSDDSEIAIHLLADNADLGEVVMEDMLPRKFHDPVDDILEYILTTSTAEIAIASDADVFALCAVSTTHILSALSSCPLFRTITPLGALTSSCKNAHLALRLTQMALEW
ncbi:hypothetical protein OBBRIDRAFT_605307 [Obba rivulosa]|uniref:Uncharacterized protein n=1 Tax=Obba rivulosa TaxID=1052685 RepID=A0A8E2DKD5_9APHY|nr:hypothetical protein OBBRIDRAFT_605307 [Obba rivulosa]